MGPSAAVLCSAGTAVSFCGALLTCVAAMGQGKVRASPPDASVGQPSNAQSAPTKQWRRGSAPPLLRKLYSQHLGEWLRGAPTHSFDVGLLGTDLGWSVPYGTSRLFLFGDAIAGDQTLNGSKPFAWVPNGKVPEVLQLPRLRFATGYNGVFSSASASGVDLGVLTVPTGGIVLGGTIYVYYTAAWDQTQQTQTKAVLAHAHRPDLRGMTRDFAVPTVHFTGAQILEDGDDLLIWGEGPYRKSALYFATVPKRHFGDHSAWRYYTGVDASGNAAFSAFEADAAPVVATDCIGEFSVVRDARLGGFVLVYNCLDQDARGILMQTATSPIGPFSAPVKILDPQFDAYASFIHANPDVIGFDDGLSDWGRETEWGFEYAPGLVPDWIREDAPGVTSLVYTLSSWNPYTVHLVRAVVGTEGASATAPLRGAGLPKAALRNADFATGDVSGWAATGDPFSVRKLADGTNLLTTLGAKGAQNVGRITQDFTIDATTSELAFTVSGSGAVVALVRGGDMIRSTHPRGSDANVVSARWRLEDYRGEKVTLVVADDVADGYLNVGPFVLR